MKRFPCPCCGYPTLNERESFEICRLCDWEDDGQDDPHADELSGPNGDYSLTEARENYKKHYTMYREERNILSMTEQEVSTKKALMIEYDLLRAASSESAKQIWQKIYPLEELLHQIMLEEIERFQREIKNRKNSGNTH